MHLRVPLNGPFGANNVVNSREIVSTAAIELISDPGSELTATEAGRLVIHASMERTTHGRQMTAWFACHEHIRLALYLQK